jgi:2,4-dienoyl-CoA reductase-like NADH-dependent reductase (Old Yellow Enzyme family)
MNFPIAVAQAVRDALGPKLIAGFRITPFESEPDGYTLEDAKLLCNELAKLAAGAQWEAGRTAFGAQL